MLLLQCITMLDSEYCFIFCCFLFLYQNLFTTQSIYWTVKFMIWHIKRCIVTNLFGNLNKKRRCSCSSVKCFALKLLFKTFNIAMANKAGKMLNSIVDHCFFCAFDRKHWDHMVYSIIWLSAYIFQCSGMWKHLQVNGLI